MSQNFGLQNVGLHNHCFEQTVDIISHDSGQVVREKVFGLFIENVTSLGMNYIGFNLKDIPVTTWFRMWIFLTIFLANYISKIFLAFLITMD
jgi:hypothetical protein